MRLKTKSRSLPGYNRVSRAQLPPVHDKYLYADLPQVGVVNGGHEEPLGNIVEVSGIPHCGSLSTSAVVFCEGRKILVIQFTFPSIQACVVGRSSVKVARINISSFRGQEVTYNPKPSGTWFQ